MHNFFRPGRNGNSAGSDVTHRPMVAEINRCRLGVAVRFLVMDTIGKNEWPPRVSSLILHYDTNIKQNAIFLPYKILKTIAGILCWIPQKHAHTWLRNFDMPHIMTFFTSWHSSHHDIPHMKFFTLVPSSHLYCFSNSSESLFPSYVMPGHVTGYPSMVHLWIMSYHYGFMHWTKHLWDFLVCKHWPCITYNLTCL